MKVRDGLLDMEEGEDRRDPGGLQRSSSRAASCRFPSSARNSRAIAAQLRVVLPIDGDRCTFDAFLGLVRQHGELVAVGREDALGFTIDSVICEYTQVYFNGALVESACVESERYDAMRR